MHAGLRDGRANRRRVRHANDRGCICARIVPTLPPMLPTSAAESLPHPPDDPHSCTHAQWAIAERHLVIPPCCSRPSFGQMFRSDAGFAPDCIEATNSQLTPRSFPARSQNVPPGWCVEGLPTLTPPPPRGVGSRSRCQGCTYSTTRTSSVAGGDRSMYGRRARLGVSGQDSGWSPVLEPTSLLRSGAGCPRGKARGPRRMSAADECTAQMR